MSFERKPFERPPWLALAFALLPMVLLIVECVRSSYADRHLIRKTALTTEIGRLRLTATRRAGQLEAMLNSSPAVNFPELLQDRSWLSQFANESNVSEPHQLYSAVVDSTGMIVWHSNPAFIGTPLHSNWYDETVPEAGTDVVRLRDSLVDGGRAAYDVRVRLIVQGRQMGEYHQGLDADWFDAEVSSLQQASLNNTLPMLIAVLAVTALGIGALWKLAQRDRLQSRRVESQARAQATQLAQIASGLAHEIRNPLHALRLNLHMLRRSFSGRTQLNPQDMADTLQQSDSAIDSMETVLRDLLRFATPQEPPGTEINIISELRATLSLMEEEMRRKQIDVRTSIPQQTVAVRIDPARLRQMLVNLLTYSQNHVGAAGTIEIDVSNGGSSSAITISDNGPALSDAQHLRMFEPFHSPEHATTGLGMALVKSFAEEAGGSVMCEPRQPTGCRFRVVLPSYSVKSRGA